MMKSFRNMNRTVCRRVSRVGQYVAGHVVTARLEQLPDEVERILNDLLRATGVTGAESWQSVAVPGASDSVESKQRTEPDASIGAALVFHVMREQDALDTCDALMKLLDQPAKVGAYQLLCELRHESLKT